MFPVERVLAVMVCEAVSNRDLDYCACLYGLH